MLSSRDPVAVTKAAKQLVQAGKWRTLPGRDDRAKILTALKDRLPFALGLVQVDALVALAKQPPSGGCYWCSALVQRLPDRPELERTADTVAALGEGCATCRARWAAAAVAQQEAAHVAALVAAGFRPEAAAHLRTAEQVSEHTRSLRSLGSAKPPPRPQPPYYGSRRLGQAW